jgi:hypothetical protein
LLINLLTIDIRSGTSRWRYQQKQATKGSVTYYRDHRHPTNDQLDGLGLTSAHGNLILNVEKFSAKLRRSEGGKTRRKTAIERATTAFYYSVNVSTTLHCYKQTRLAFWRFSHICLSEKFCFVSFLGSLVKFLSSRA